MEDVRATLAGLRGEVELFRRLFSYTRPYRGRLILSWLATAGYAASGALLVAIPGRGGALADVQVGEVDEDICGVGTTPRSVDEVGV